MSDQANIALFLFSSISIVRFNNSIYSASVELGQKIITFFLIAISAGDDLAFI